MKITMESTDQIVRVGGREARRWRGRTESGIEVDVFVPVIRVSAEADLEQFERELRELPQPEYPAIELKFLT